MVVAWLTFHPRMSWLTAEASLNINSKLVTFPTCHEPRGLLKVLALWNMCCIVVTLETSQESMSSSKLCLP